MATVDKLKMSELLETAELNTLEMQVQLEFLNKDNIELNHRAYEEDAARTEAMAREITSMKQTIKEMDEKIIAGGGVTNSTEELLEAKMASTKRFEKLLRESKDKLQAEEKAKYEMRDEREEMNKELIEMIKQRKTMIEEVAKTARRHKEMKDAMVADWQQSLGVGEEEVRMRLEESETSLEGA